MVQLKKKKKQMTIKRNLPSSNPLYVTEKNRNG